MKKIISITLTLIMLLSFTTPAFANDKSNVDKFVEEVTGNIQTTAISMKKIADLSKATIKKLEPIVVDFVLDSQNWEKAGEALMNVIVKAIGKITPDEPGDSEKPDNPDVPNPPQEPELPSFTDILKNLSIEDFVNLIKKYFIVNLEDIDSTSQDIVDMAEYKYVTTQDGKVTVYIVIDIEKHPEILNRDVMMETVKKLYEKQNEEFSEDADILMSYEHIAGELALHAILYAVTNEYLQITGETEGTIYNLWQKAKQADLNFDENRVPKEIIEITGTYIMGVFIVSFYTLFKAFG
ncbi:MAG: hypothetical protein ACI4GC_06700 [Acutalibacteraceae bacterium]